MAHKIEYVKNDGGIYLRIDDCSNAIDYLEQVLDFLRGKKDSRLKWVSISLFHALYGFCVLAVKGTNPSKRSPEGTGIAVNDYLLCFDKVLKRIQDKASLNPPVSLNDSKKKNFEILKNMLRNNFLHFVPKSQSIEVSELPAIVVDALDVIENLAERIPDFKSEDPQHIQNLIEDIRKEEVLFSIEKQ